MVFFQRSYVVPHSCNVSWLGLTGSGFMMKVGGSWPPGYLMSKKPRLVSAKSLRLKTVHAGYVKDRDKK